MLPSGLVRPHTPRIFTSPSEMSNVEMSMPYFSAIVLTDSSFADVPVHRAGELVSLVLQCRRDVAPRLSVRSDLPGITGQPVQSLRQRPDMLDHPRDAVLHESTDRIGDECQGVQPGRDRAQRRINPATVLDAARDLLDIVGDPHSRPRIDRRVCPACYQRIRAGHYGLTAFLRARLRTSCLRDTESDYLESAHSSDGCPSKAARVCLELTLVRAPARHGLGGVVARRGGSIRGSWSGIGFRRPAWQPGRCR